MSSFEKCGTCGTYAFMDRHICPPAWEVRIAEDDDHYPGEDDPKRVYALDAADAAESWAEWWDGGDSDYHLASGGEVALIINPSAHPEQTRRLTVSGAMVPEYRATEGG